MNKTTVHVKGMHCRSCEILVEDELTKIPGVCAVEVSQKKGTAEIFYKTVSIDENNVVKAVQNAGYEIGRDDIKPFFSKNPNDYIDIGIAGIILAILYLLINDLGLLKLFTISSNNTSSLPVVFLIGLTAGLSTCMALVGGLVLGASARFAEKHPEATNIQKFKPHLFFNLGRIIGFFVLGGIIGAAGSIFQLSTFTLGFLTITVGGIMLLLGLQLTELFPKFNSINFTLPKSIGRLFGIKNGHQKEYSHKKSFIMGALTFFLPCGFTQAMQLYSISTGNPLIGALTMATFAVGTAPGLLGIGGLTSVIKGAFAKSFFKFVGLIVVALAFFNISNGFNLTGNNLLPSFNPTITAEASDPNVIVKDGIQVVKMIQDASGYTPNSFTIKKNIPVRWIITSEDINTCASSIVSAKLGLRQGLQLGENVIEFTPKETGQIRFSCIMGMYGGVFNVIDDNKNSLNAENNNEQLTTQINVTPVAALDIESRQIIKAIYTYENDIQPNQFAIKAGQPIRLEIDAKDDGAGCMGSVTIPGLTQKIEVFSKGKTNIFEFTAQKPGNYYLTCAMGVPRGVIIVN